MENTDNWIQIRANWKRYVEFLSAKKNVFVLSIFIGLALGTAYIWLKKTRYHAHLSFMINEKESGGSGALLSLAGQFGLFGGGGGIGANDDKVIFLLQSRNIIGNALLHPLDTKQKIADGLYEQFKLANTFSNDTSMIQFHGFESTPYSQLSYAQNKALDKIIELLMKSGMLSSESVKRKSLVAQPSGILHVDVITKNEALSKAFADAIFVEIQQFYIQQAVGRQQENYAVLCHRADSLKQLILAKEQQYGAAADYNTGLIKTSGRIDEMRLKKEVELLNIMYAEVLKNREVARITLDQQKPFFQIIDQPQLPLEEIKPSIAGTLFLGVFAGFSMCWFFISAFYFASQRKLNH